MVVGVEGEEAVQEPLQVLGREHLPLHDHLHHRRPEVAVRVARPLHDGEAPLHVASVVLAQGHDVGGCRSPPPPPARARPPEGTAALVLGGIGGEGPGREQGLRLVVFSLVVAAEQVAVVVSAQRGRAHTQRARGSSSIATTPLAFALALLGHAFLVTFFKPAAAKVTMGMKMPMVILVPEAAGEQPAQRRDGRCRGAEPALAEITARQLLPGAIAGGLGGRDDAGAIDAVPVLLGSADGGRRARPAGQERLRGRIGVEAPAGPQVDNDVGR